MVNYYSTRPGFLNTLKSNLILIFEENFFLRACSYCYSQALGLLSQKHPDLKIPCLSHSGPPILHTKLSLWSESECGEDPYSSIVPIRIIPKTSKIVPSVKATTYTYYAALFYFTSNLIQLLIGPPRIWLSDSVCLSGRGGVGFAPRPRHTKDVKNSTYCFSVRR